MEEQRLGGALGTHSPFILWKRKQRPREKNRVVRSYLLDGGGARNRRLVAPSRVLPPTSTLPRVNVLSPHSKRHTDVVFHN